MADPKRFVLLWLDEERQISRTAFAPIRRAVEDQVKDPRERVEVDIWLESPGGDAHAAYKLAVLLRAVASRVRVVVPDFAKSAATLLSLAGDDIYMAPAADFGPLDAQMPDEGSVSGSISALNIARAADEVARDAVDMAVRGGADMLAITGLSRAQTLEAMLRFSASFSEPLVCQLDPKVVHHAKQMLLVTAKYAERILKHTGNPHARRIATALVETFPTHGYVISPTEADELGLPIRPMEAYEYAAEAQAMHRAAEDGDTVFAFCPLSAVTEPPKKEAPEAKATTRTTKGGGKSNGRAANRSRSQLRSNGVAATTDGGS